MYFYDDYYTRRSHSYICYFINVQINTLLKKKKKENITTM